MAAPLPLRWSGAVPVAFRRAVEREVARGLDAPPGATLHVLSAAAPSPPGGGGEAWIGLTTDAEPARVREAVAAGAYDVVALGAPDAVARVVRRLAELGAPDRTPPAVPGLVARSPAMRALLARLERAAHTSIPVLLTGETGTGKELAARQLHRWSPRADHAFVPINCSAIPNDLMEAELFGYVRGAFSGAVRAYDGQLWAARGGTVFLDEIDDTPPSIQVKLLRVLEDRVVSRLGENAWREVDFRVVAATNRDLRGLVERGQFARDFYERLAILNLEIPPLRERTEEIAPLVRHFVARFRAEEPAATAVVVDVTPEALAILEAAPWPGNVRELRNAIFAALAAKRSGTELLPSDLPRRLLAPTVVVAGGCVDRERVRAAVRAGAFDLRLEIDALERVALDEALEVAGGNASEAARRLGTVGRGRARDPGGTLRAMRKRLGRPSGE